MATTNPRDRRSDPAEADGLGIAHLTVVPTNFDPDEHGRGREE